VDGSRNYLRAGEFTERGDGVLGLRRKDKAGAVFGQIELTVATKASFSEAFPSVTRARIEVEESFYRRSVIHQLTEDDAREFVDCSNRACYGGGVSIGDVLRRMVITRRHEATETQLCRGYEGSKRHRIRDCAHRFTVRVELQYREAEPSMDLRGVRSSDVPWFDSSRHVAAFAASRFVIDAREERVASRG
jgi:hypothetical protein